MVPVEIQDCVVESLSVKSTLELVEESMEGSGFEWRFAHRGELREHGYWPICHSGPRTLRYVYQDDELVEWCLKKDDYQASLQPEFIKFNAIKILNAMYVGLLERDPAGRAEWRVLKQWLMEDAPGGYIGPLILLTAMVSCGLSVNMFDWVSGKFKAIVAVIHGQRQLVLVSSSNIRNSQRQTEDEKLYCLQVYRHNERRYRNDVLLGPDGKNGLICVGLLRRDVPMRSVPGPNIYHEEYTVPLLPVNPDGHLPHPAALLMEKTELVKIDTDMDSVGAGFSDGEKSEEGISGNIINV